MTLLLVILFVGLLATLAFLALLFWSHWRFARRVGGHETCPGCGGDAGDNWFDRSICACGVMHTCCRTCGLALDGCPYDVSVAEDDKTLDLTFLSRGRR